MSCNIELIQKIKEKKIRIEILPPFGCVSFIKCLIDSCPPMSLQVASCKTHRTVKKIRRVEDITQLCHSQMPCSAVRRRGCCLLVWGCGGRSDPSVAGGGGGGFVPGGGGFDPEETGTWESLVVVWRAACDSCKNRVSFWAMAVFGLGRIPSVSRTCPAVSLGFFLFLIENQGILGDTRIQPYPAVSTRPIGNSCRVRAF